MTTHVAYGLMLLACLLSYTSMIEAACTPKLTCEECLMATASWSFLTDVEYCKFCPRPTLTHRFPFDDEARFLPDEMSGACFHGSSSDSRAQDTIDQGSPVLGGCGLTSRQSTWSVNGWLVPGRSIAQASNRTTRVANLTEIRTICESIRHVYYSASDEEAGTRGAAATSSLMLSNVETTKALRVAVRVAAQVRRDLLLTLKLRAVDPHFFYRTFPNAELAQQIGKEYAWKAAKTTASLLLPHTSYVISTAETAATVYKFLQERAEPVMYYGGSANTYAFPDVTYTELYKAYTYVLKKLKKEAPNGVVTYEAAKVLLNKLKKSAEEKLESIAASAKTVASVAHKVNIHPVATGLKVTAHVLAAVLSGGLSLPVSAGMAAGQMAFDASLESIAKHSLRDKVRMMIGSEYNLEGSQQGYFVLDQNVSSILPETSFVRGPLFCDITNYDEPNHGCAAGMRCIRGHGAFFPLNPTVFVDTYKHSHGHCGPADSTQLGVGAPCVLDVDCQSGFCDTGSVAINVTIAGEPTTVHISSMNRAFRGDMVIDEPYYYKELEPKERIVATHGFCRLALPPKSEGCEAISGDISFWRCKDRQIPPRFFDTPTTTSPLLRSKTTDDLPTNRDKEKEKEKEKEKNNNKKKVYSQDDSNVQYGKGSLQPSNN